MRFWARRLLVNSARGPAKVVWEGRIIPAISVLPNSWEVPERVGVDGVGQAVLHGVPFMGVQVLRSKRLISAA